MNEAANKPTGYNLIDGATPILVFLFSLGYLCFFLRYSSLEPDEGILLQGAQRILDGQIPYRDFFSFYTPGSFYLVAALFKFFGNSFFAVRFSLAITGAGCAVLTYLLARRVCSRGHSLFAAALAVTAGVAYRFLVLHNWYSTFLASLALYCAVRLLESREPVWAFATGTFCSLTGMFEQSKGAGLCLGLVLSLVALRLVGQKPALQKSLFQRSRLTALVAGFVWPLILIFAFFGAQHSLGIMVEDWLWPLRHYTNANHVFYGYQNWSDSARDSIFHSGPLWARVVKILAISPGFLVPLLPLLAVGLLIYWLSPNQRRRLPLDKGNYDIVVSGVLSGLLVSVIAARADIIHFMYLAPLWYVPLAWILDARQFRSATLLALRPYLVFLIGVGFGLMSLVILTTANSAQNRIVTRRGVIMTGEQDGVIDYVQNHTTSGQKILVYPYLPLYYYLTGTRSPAPLDYFQPGMNTFEQAQEIIASLRSQNVNTVLFEASFSEKIATSWPDTPLRSIANDRVADYIVRNYRSCRILNSASASRFQFMVQKSNHCP
jgi:4-amino-4-deoxy-L-arabinose transferase-like glycosyltransferase